MIAEKMTLEGKTIILDGGSFYACQFKGCTLIFNGVLPVVMERCSFDGDCKWQFSGPAQNTIVFMQALYAGGAKDLIENTFRNIRGESVEQGPTLH